jgi:hypothetical protein
MNIWELDRIVLFLLFFVPGFISLKVYDLLVPREYRDFSRSLFEAVGFSSLNYAVLLPVIIPIHLDTFPNEHPFWYYLFLFLIVGVFPILWPILFYWISTSSLGARFIVHPMRKPWDYVFGKRQAYWVIVHLRDGRRIGGRFDRKSFASSFPADEQIYIEEVWRLDTEGKFKPNGKVERSQGIIVLRDEILAVEFLT